MTNSVNNSFEQVQKKFNDAFEAFGNYSVSQRDKAIREMKTTLDELDAEIDRMENRVRENWNSMSDEAKQATSDSLRQLKEGRNEMGETLGEMKASGEKAWGEVKAGFEGAWKQFKSAWRSADEKSGPVH
jgi:DUF438 domain-containing protein